MADPERNFGAADSRGGYTTASRGYTIIHNRGCNRYLLVRATLLLVEMHNHLLVMLKMVLLMR